MAPDDVPAAVPARVLDAALQRSAGGSWDALHLHDVAADLGLSLAELGRHVPDKHSLGQLLFDRADQSLLACADMPGWGDRSPAERLELSLMAWLDALTPHRPQARQILQYSLQPDHLHLQLQGVLRVSRTVQWWREASCLPVAGLKRELLEAALTAIYLSTVASWLGEHSPDNARTRRRLARNLRLSAWAGQALLRA